MIEEFVTNVLEATEERVEAAVEANVKRDVQAGVYQVLIGPALQKLRDGLSSFAQKNTAGHRSLETINVDNIITNHISIARTAETGKSVTAMCSEYFGAKGKGPVCAREEPPPTSTLRS